jgi:adenylate kinase
VKNQLSSLNTEHVSPASLARREISRRTPLGHKAETAARRGQPLADETTLALMRRWFWTRKPDAGFVLTGFPATLLQAKVFDEWLDARDESLDAVLDASSAGDTDSHLVIQHYRDQGLLHEEELPAPAAA